MRQLLLITLSFFCFFSNAQNSRFLIPYREGNRWGFCDTLGKGKITPKYKSVDFFKANDNTKSPASKVFLNDSIYTYIDSAGKNILPLLNIKQTVILTFVDDCIAFILKNQDNKYGLFYDKKIITQTNYDEIILTHNRNTIVRQNNKYGMINDKGELIVPVQFDKIRLSYYYTTPETLIWLCIKGKNKVKYEDKIKYEFAYDDFKKNTYLFNLRDEDEMKQLSEELARKANQENTINSAQPKATTPSIGDLKNSTTVEPLPHDIEKNLRDSLKKIYGLDSILKLPTKNRFYYVEKSGKQGIIDDSLNLFLMNYKHKITTIFINSRVSWLFTENQSLALFVYEKDGKFGITNEFDDTILAPIYENINLHYSNKYFEYYKNNRVGIFMPNTYYKPIKPKYNKLYTIHSFNISKKWSFTLYDAYEKTSDNKNKFLGYVGENGIEYFKN